MKYIQLGIHLSSELGIRSVTIDHNDTELESSSELIEIIAISLLKGIQKNKEDIMLQDILDELNIK